MQLRAVTFDYWNTLIVETVAPLKLRRSLWTELFAEAGRAVSEEELTAAFRHGWEGFEQRWKANQPAQPAQSAADAAAFLGVDPTSSLGTELVAAHLDASLAVPRELLPNVGETFASLKDAGVAIGIVCDVGAVHSQQLRTWLVELGVYELVDHCSFSDEVGVFKPDPTIFAHALGGLGGVEPAQSAHVGDLRRTDVAGARAHRMFAVRYSGGRDDTEEGHDEADHVISDHLELLEVFDLG